MRPPYEPATPHLWCLQEEPLGKAGMAVHACHLGPLEVDGGSGGGQSKTQSAPPPFNMQLLGNQTPGRCAMDTQAVWIKTWRAKSFFPEPCPPDPASQGVQLWLLIAAGTSFPTVPPLPWPSSVSIQNTQES